MSTPQEVIDACREFLSDSETGDLPFDLASISWEGGTTAIAVFRWDSTAVARVIFDADLNFVRSEGIGKPKQKRR